MRKLFPVLLIFLTACSSNPGKKNENKEYVVSMEGLDELKIGMSQAELEKLLNQKLVLTNAEANAVSWLDTAQVKYKDIAVTLCFQRQYPGDSTFYMFLYALRSNSPQCRTATGVGIGDNKDKIINSYPDNYIDMGPAYDNDTSTTISKTRYRISVKNEYSREIIFSLNNKKLSSFEVTMIFDQSD